ncbi:hypothetical protein NX059_001983 [Plenodomus lindquistii]|nr:hypothetical protein NX059_001983 [Plenodomus lindquistii]
MFDHVAYLQELFGTHTWKDVLRVGMKDMDNDFVDLTTTLKLPYEAEEHPKIPSIAEIKRAVNLNAKSGCGRSVFQLGELVIKSTDFSLVQEAEVLLFLRQHSQIRVPTVYAVFQDEASGDDHGKGTEYFMVMENIKGAPISSESWLMFGPETRQKICFRMAEQLRLLRDTPAPSYYGTIHNRGWYCHLNLLSTRYRENCGPYDSYADFCNAAMASFRRDVAISLSCPFTEEEDHARQLLLLSELESKMASWHAISQPTFTHIDPNPNNIIVRQIQDSQGGEDWEVTFIDWAHCGWFPKWMQAVTWREAYHIGAEAPDGSWKVHTQEAKEMREMVFQQMGEETYDEQVDLFGRMNEHCHRRVF